jgi:membrane protease YdiL (CAAX protease family)
MKTYVTFGFGSAIAGAILTLALYFLGFHSSPEKIGTAQMIQMIAGTVIAVVFIVLGTKARRAEVPVTEPFGYGQALGAGMMVSLFAVLFGVIFGYLYSQFINPGMMDVAAQAQIDKWEKAGMSSSQIDTAEKMMRKMMSPGLQAVFGFIGGLFFSLIISLITSAFLKRPAEAVQPAEPPVTA